MNTERRNAFLEAAHLCEAEILDPHTDPPQDEAAAILRMTCEAAMRGMAAKFRRLAEEAGRPQLRSVPPQSEEKP